MRLVPGTFLRVGLLLVLAVVLQLSTLSQMTILGGSFDVVVLVVAATAFYGVPFGLRHRLRGRFPARPAQRRDDGRFVARAHRGQLQRGPLRGDARSQPRPAAAGRGGRGHGAWVVAFAGVSFMLDVGATVSPLVLREMVVTVLLNTLIALPVFALCCGACCSRAGRRSPGGARPTPPAPRAVRSACEG